MRPSCWPGCESTRHVRRPTWPPPTGVLSEQQAMTELTGRAAIPGYIGAADQLVDSALQRARHYLKDTP